MATDLSTYVHAPGLVLEAMGDEALVLHLAHNTCFALNPTGLLIWQRLAAGDTLTQIATCVADTFDTDIQSARRDLDAFIDALLSSGLITPR
jgi:hypothetical protein